MSHKILHEHTYSISVKEGKFPSRAELPEIRFEMSIVNAVWEKAQKEFGFVFFKRDQFGGIIAKHDYGKQTQYGWEIARIVPLSLGGTDSIDNLQPFHWKNVASKGEQ